VSAYTPGVGGYAVGIVVSWLAFLVPFVFLGPYVVVVAFFVMVVGTPVGVVGAVVTHLACRHAPNQATHVLVAGLCGFTIMLLLGELAEGDDTGLLLLASVWVGVAAAVGRASVICLVPERQAQVEPR
jgi:hypothetical protein